MAFLISSINIHIVYTVTKLVVECIHVNSGGNESYKNEAHLPKKETTPVIVTIANI